MDYEYIIIGAGSSGCVLANSLSANNKCTVLLQEAGKPDKKLEIGIPGAYPKLNRTSEDWSFWTEPQVHVDNRKIYIPRGKAPDGSRSTNGQGIYQ
jgi:choline dehydrogenase